MGARVMVVDDHADIRDTLSIILEDEGYEVVAAGSGADAIERLREGPRPCVILLDLMMPGMNGWEFRRQQQRDEALSDIPVVLISGANDVHRQMAPLQAEGYLRKPFDIDVMLRIVRSCCAPGDQTACAELKLRCVDSTTRACPYIIPGGVNSPQSELRSEPTKPGGSMEVEKSTWKTKVGLATQLKGGVIMDVTNPEQALIAAEAGAAAVMALERVPSDIRAQGGVARMTDPKIILDIIEALREKRYEIPVMAKARIGHFVEAQILEALGVDFIDESEVLTPADEEFHINKHMFRAPFVCGCRDLGEALRRIGEGAAMIRTKGEAGTGNVVEAVRHMRAVQRGIRKLAGLREEELMTEAKNLQAPYDLVVEVAHTGKLPVPNFSAGGCATPADAALMMQLGAEAVFVGSGIFKAAAGAADPDERRALTLGRAKAIVAAVTYYDDPKKLAEVSTDLGEPMPGLDVRSMDARELMAARGW